MNDYINLVLVLIFVWIIFWIGRSIYLLNDEEFFYKKSKKCSRKDNPVLFYTELTASLFWGIVGLAVLTVVLYSLI